MRPAAKAEQARHPDFMGPAIDADLDEFGAERIGDSVLEVGTADHAHLPLVHGAKRIQRRAIRLPLAIFLDHADAERVERLFTFERLVALGRFGDRCLAKADGFLGLVDQFLTRHHRPEQPLPDLVAHHHHGRAGARGGVGATGDGGGRQVAIAQENGNLFDVTD